MKDHVLAGLRERQWALLPRLRRGGAKVLARLLWRALYGELRERPDLRVIDVRGWPPETALARLDSAARQSPRGWLLLEQGWRSLGAPAQILASLRAAQGCQLLLESEEVLELDEDTLSRILALDSRHLTATDPALQQLRAVVLSHARAGSNLQLIGASGSGRRSLVRWAHAELEGPGIEDISPERPLRPAPGVWLEVRHPSALPARVLEQLHRRHHIRHARPPAPPVDAVARPDHPAFRAIVGASPALVGALTRAVRLAPTELSVMVLGERGTGKELFARAIHDASGRAGPLVVVDLSSVPEGLVESELFGHVRGAFTGANRDHLGALQRAEHGTLFIDEIGNLSRTIQVKLLRVLQSRTFTPVGGERPQTANVRIISATNEDLQLRAQTGDFRDDLLDRLAQVALHLPPLRERHSDIAPLARAFARVADPTLRPSDAIFSDEALAALHSWPWPGNVRELQHLVQQAVVLRSGATVSLADLGDLAACTARPAPMFYIVDEQEAEEGGGLARPDSRVPVVCHVPCLRERGAASVRDAVLHHLAGGGITDDALEILVEHPWWGELPELQRTVGALCHEGDRWIDRRLLVERFPHLLERYSSAPIIALLHPTEDTTGALSGFLCRFDTSALFVGRAHTLAELTSASEDLAPRKASGLLERAVGRQPQMLHLGALPLLSRLHLLIVRDRDGLVAREADGVCLLTYFTSAETLTPVRLSATQDTPLRSGGELRLVSPEGHEHARLYLFSAPAALSAAEPWILSRLPNACAPTREREREPPSNRVWELRPEETSALVDLLLQSLISGGALTHELRTLIPVMLHGPELERARRYLDSARPTQSLFRLIEHEQNRRLRQALWTGLCRAQGRQELWRRLPERLRAVLMDEGWRDPDGQ